MSYSEQVLTGPQREAHFAQGSILPQQTADLLALPGNGQDQGNLEMAKKVANSGLPYVNPYKHKKDSDPQFFSQVREVSISPWNMNGAELRHELAE